MAPGVVTFQGQRVLFLGMAVVMGTLSLVFSGMSFSWQVLLLVSLVVLAGLPHGALDPFVAQKAGFWQDGPGLARFLLLYLAMAALALGVWVVAPGLCLGLFLAYSAWHFAADWRADLGLWERLAYGTLIITGPALFHPVQVESIFAVLSSESAAAVIVEASGWIGYAAVGGSCLTVLRRLHEGRPAGWEGGILLACVYWLPPLLFFIVYFAGQHSPRHLFHAAKGLSRRVAWTGGITFTVLSVLLGLAAFWMLAPAAMDDRLLRITFIGLAVLTVPHMLLIEVAANKNPDATA
jgi:Brp/Blh family beta-carotene 15,15'-monooxygenase